MSETAQGGIVVICGLIVFIYGILRWVIWGYKKDAKFIEKAKKDGRVAIATYQKTETNVKWKPNSAGREYRTICHNTYAYRVRSGKQYTFTRSKDVTYDTGRRGINNIRVYYDEKNPRKIKFDGNGARNQHQVQTGCGYTALATFCTMFLVARLLAHLFS